MAAPIERAIELFRFNLESVELRLQFNKADDELWSQKIIDAMFGFSQSRKRRQAVERLQSRKDEFETAIRELEAGQTVQAVQLLQEMIQELLQPERQISTWGMLCGDSIMYHTPRSFVPGAAQLDAKALQIIAQLIRDLTPMA